MLQSVVVIVGVTARLLAPLLALRDDDGGVVGAGVSGGAVDGGMHGVLGPPVRQILCCCCCPPCTHCILGSLTLYSYALE